MTQSNPFRVGLIGAGARWVPREHVPALAGVAEAEIYAVCRTGQIFICGVRASGLHALVALLAVALPEQQNSLNINFTDLRDSCARAASARRSRSGVELRVPICL